MSKLLILPLILYAFSEHFATPTIAPLSSISSAIFIIIGLVGISISDLIILRFGDGGVHFWPKSTRLVDVGFYARTRHPYLWFFSIYQYGNLLFYTGYQWQTLFISLGLSFFYLVLLKVIQEPQLQRFLNDRYTEYKQVTPFWYWKLKIPEDKRVELRPQLVWIFGMLVLRFWYKIKLDGIENIPHSRPFLIVANHESYLDPFLFGIFLPFEIKFVTTADVFTTPLMRFLLRGTGSFPMHRHHQDLKSIRTMIRMVNKGQVVCIFPEGGRSIDGSPLPILKETLKLIQRCKVPILPVHLEGAYEIWPRWAPNRRRGSVKTTLAPMIPVEDQSDLKVLESKINAAIFTDPKIFSRVRSRNIAKGLDDFLWACSECKTRNSIRVIGSDEIQCEQCKLQWKVSDNYLLTEAETSKSQTTISWINEINGDMLNYTIPLDHQTLSNPDEVGYISTPIVKYIGKDGSQFSDHLNLLLTDQRMILTQSRAIIHSWDLSSITIFTMDYFNAVSIGVGGVRHKFTLPQGEISLKWQTYFDKLKALSRDSLKEQANQTS